MLKRDIVASGRGEAVSRFDAVSPRPLSYTVTARVLHAAIAMMVMFTFAWGWWMQTISKTPPGTRADAFNLHKSIGLTVLALMILRVVWRRMHPPPPLPPLPALQRRAAQVNHAALYVALVAMPVAGLLGSACSGYPVKYFGMTVPTIAAKSLPLKEFCSSIHLWVSWVLLAAFAAHMAGAIKHAAIDRDGIVGRMFWAAVSPCRRACELVAVKRATRTLRRRQDKRPLSACKSGRSPRPCRSDSWCTTHGT